MSQYHYGYPSRHRRAPVQESIYRLIENSSHESVKEPMYKSKFPHDTPPTASTFGSSTVSQTQSTNLAGNYVPLKRVHRHKGDSGTFGPPKENFYSDPTHFQPKHTMPLLPPPSHFEYSKVSGSVSSKERVDSLNPPISFVEAAQQKLSNQKNFIAANALQVITQEARKPVDKTIVYRNKPDFGKVPAYLSTVKENIIKEKEYVRSVLLERSMLDEMGRSGPGIRLMDQADQQELINKLKQKWEQVNRNYQGMTHLVTLDTVGKTTKKEEFERQLEQLEKSIERLSKPAVYIQDNQAQPNYQQY